MPPLKRCITLLFFLLFLQACDFSVKDEDKDRGTVTGIVKNVLTNGTDLAIEIEGYDGGFYLNRYLKTDRSIDTFRELLLNRTVRVKCFAFNSRSRPIDTLFVDSLILY